MMNTTKEWNKYPATCTWKWMVGRRLFPFGKAYFQGHVSFRAASTGGCSFASHDSNRITSRSDVGFSKEKLKGYKSRWRKIGLRGVIVVQISKEIWISMKSKSLFFGKIGFQKLHKLTKTTIYAKQNLLQSCESTKNQKIAFITSIYIYAKTTAIRESTWTGKKL